MQYITVIHLLVLCLRLTCGGFVRKKHGNKVWIQKTNLFSSSQFSKKFFPCIRVCMCMNVCMSAWTDRQTKQCRPEVRTHPHSDVTQSIIVVWLTKVLTIFLTDYIKKDTLLFIIYEKFTSIAWCQSYHECQDNKKHNQGMKKSDCGNALEIILNNIKVEHHSVLPESSPPLWSRLPKIPALAKNNKTFPPSTKSLLKHI